MTALRRAAAVGVAAPGLGAWARGAGEQGKKKEQKVPQGATRVELATAGSAILCSATELHTRCRGRGAAREKSNARAGARVFCFVMTGVGFEPTPPKRRELESPALDHSAIQPWPRPRRTAGQRRRKSLLALLRCQRQVGEHDPTAI